jgi:uncharacterized membrane protein YkoI
MRVVLAAAFFVVAAAGAETKVKLESLPPVVQAAVKDRTKDATITGISSEKENGKTTYEVEAKLNGKGRNLVFDRTGALLETEDEIDLDSVPPAARSAIQKRASGGAITLVEKVTAASLVSYEATIKVKNGKRIEYAVNADGSPHKED